MKLFYRLMIHLHDFELKTGIGMNPAYRHELSEIIDDYRDKLLKLEINHGS